MKKKIKKLVMILSVLPLLVSYNNCSGTGNFSTEENMSDFASQADDGGSQATPPSTSTTSTSTTTTLRPGTTTTVPNVTTTTMPGVTTTTIKVTTTTMAPTTTTTVPAPSNVTKAVFCPSSASINSASSAKLVWFDRNLSGGAHAWVFNSAEVIKGLAAYCGLTSLDSKLLEQIRYILDGARAPTATGGYQDQKQVGAAFMLLLAKNTSRIWSALSANEQAKSDAIMEALMYSSTYTTKDTTWGTIGLDGGANLNRDWNPNYQNGMAGMMVVTSYYFGASNANNMLANFNHAAFLAKLKNLGLSNLVTTYTLANGSPSISTIESNIRKDLGGGVRWKFHGRALNQQKEVLRYLMTRTFSKKVFGGYNNCNGATVGGNFLDAGRIVNKALCGSVPNINQTGMMFEFNTVDANGLRSDAHYVWDGWYVLNYVRMAVQIFGGMDSSNVSSDSPVAYSSSDNSSLAKDLGVSTLPLLPMSEIFKRSNIGTNDMFWKLSPDANKGGGYIRLAKGANRGTTRNDAAFIQENGSEMARDIFNIMQRVLGLSAVSN